MTTKQVGGLCGLYFYQWVRKIGVAQTIDSLNVRQVRRQSRDGYDWVRSAALVHASRLCIFLKMETWLSKRTVLAALRFERQKSEKHLDC